MPGTRWTHDLFRPFVPALVRHCAGPSLRPCPPPAAATPGHARPGARPGIAATLLAVIRLTTRPRARHAGAAPPAGGRNQHGAVRSLAAVCAAAAVAVAACGDGTTTRGSPTAATPASPAPTTPASPPPGATPPTAATASPTATGPAPGDDAQLIEVQVAGGAVEGVPRDVDVELGRAVRLVVTADVADEVHVHGYDITAPVAPDVPAVLEFEASIPGAFEVELEGSGLPLFNLRVRP